MAVEKPRTNLLSSINILYYISSCFGIIPYSLRAYHSLKVFQLSILGNIYVVIFVVQAVVQYHYARAAFSMGDKKETGEFMK